MTERLRCTTINIIRINQIEPHLQIYAGDTTVGIIEEYLLLRRLILAFGRIKRTTLPEQEIIHSKIQLVLQNIILAQYS